MRVRAWDGAGRPVTQNLVGHHLLSDKAVAVLVECVKASGSIYAWKHHSSTIRALARRGLVTLSTTGSYMSGDRLTYWIDITPAGRQAINPKETP